MPELLTDIECRIIGCLMEKSITTPDQYPLTLNALTNACNQKSSRNPVLNLSSGEVQRSARELGERKLVRVEESFKRGTEKYGHRFCNTPFGGLQFDEAQYAIICLLLLRGPQTPGELRAHSGRLHQFADNDAVLSALEGLLQRDDDPLVVQLPRSPGRKDAEYTHLFAGPVDLEAYARETQSAARTEAPASRGSSVDQASLAELNNRVSYLEQELARLKALIE